MPEQDVKALPFDSAQGAVRERARDGQELPFDSAQGAVRERARDGQELPLQGKRILVTRTREQAAALSGRLQSLGAIPVEFPVIRIVPPHDWEALDSALRKLGRDTSHPYYTWIIFTSANGVKIVCERLLNLGFHPQTLAGVRVAAIGPATAAVLANYGITADLVPGEYVAEGVAAALIEDARRGGESLQGKRILLPRAAEARHILVTELQQAGALVDEVVAYHTRAAVTNDEQGSEVLKLLRTGQLDIITFTSSSTVRNFMQWLGDSVAEFDASSTGSDARSLLPKVACIGPITAQTARDFGLNVSIEAQTFTIDGLVEAIVQCEG